MSIKTNVMIEGAHLSNQKQNEPAMAIRSDSFVLHSDGSCMVGARCGWVRRLQVVNGGLVE